MQTTTKPASPALKRARRDVGNFRAMVRRSSNWAGALQAGYAKAFAAVLALEDAEGIDAAAQLSDRLTALRHEAGLAPSEVINAERWAMDQAS